MTSEGLIIDPITRFIDQILEIRTAKPSHFFVDD